jgi:hypothetical protein
MPPIVDGPVSSRFHSLPLGSGISLADVAASGISAEMAAAITHAPEGACVCWGIPFEIGPAIVLRDQPVELALPRTTTRWLVFLHTSDTRPLEANPGGIIPASPGRGRLGEQAAAYVVRYADGETLRLPVRRRYQIGMFTRGWGENCFEAVAHHRPNPIRGGSEQPAPYWGPSQMRATAADRSEWINWLWAWENPRPDVPIVGLRLEPGTGITVLFGLAAGDVTAHPLRWETRRKAVVSLPPGEAFRPELDEEGLLAQVRLDMGQIISAAPQAIYPDDDWTSTYNNRPADLSPTTLLVEYTAHPDACFQLSGGAAVAVRALDEQTGDVLVRVVAPATQRVRLRAVERATGRPVPVKLHIHGEAGEYLAPVDRHRILNPFWFEDYSVDFAHRRWDEGRAHDCTYINGETTVDLPLGRVYVEVSKGFEIRPVRAVFTVGPDTEEITVPLDKVLDWRERGWVTADTHVHFLSPPSALLEGAAEGVNIVNLLASQWGELMTSVGDFDGKTTWGAPEAGGDGEYLVRVGTENRQHILGHISLLGYSGPIIAPMTTGGPDESAIGDPIEILLTEWARQCKRQGGVVVLPHFPNPRAEHAAAVVHGEIDAVELGTSWTDLYSGIDPYSLSDWYRYLNCGYLLAAVGGTDKMSAAMPLGAVRTYAHIPPDRAFTYAAWMDAVRRAETFVSYGPLLDFAVDGKPMGSRIELPSSGGTLDVTWQVSSVTVPMARVELVVNGEIRESQTVDAWQAAGSWRVRLERSGWVALLVRGHYDDRPEIVAAHSSPVMVSVAGTEPLAAADAVTILEQLEGALAYLDTVGTRAADRVYRRMRLELVAAHRALHNRMHEAGHYHEH